MAFVVPPTTVVAIAAVGIAVIVSRPGAMHWLRASPSRVRGEADDALSLVRMDDDGGWQMTRPSA